MEDIRLKHHSWKFASREWDLVCNMNVLADVQEAFGGDLSNALQGGTIRTVREFLAAMLNDYADSQGWQIRYTGKDLGRRISWDEFQEIQPVVMDLVMGALSGSSEEAEQTTETDNDPN